MSDDSNTVITEIRMIDLKRNTFSHTFIQLPISTRWSQNKISAYHNGSENI